MKLTNLHYEIAQSHPKLSRGMVWCRHCGRSQSVNTPHALAAGWPKCCGFTMTIDAPDERAALSEQAP